MSAETEIAFLFDQFGVFYRGIILGIVIAAPVGPIGLLCIRRTVHKGFRMGFSTGVGSAVADAFFGAIAAFGIAAILSLIENFQFQLRIIGGAVLVIMAWHMWRSQPHAPGDTKQTGQSIVKAFLSGLMLTFTNPVTIFAILAVVAALGGKLDTLDASTLVAGILAGSTLWWLVLCGGISLVRHHFTETIAVIVNRVLAVLLLGLACWALATGIGAFMAHN